MFISLHASLALVNWDYWFAPFCPIKIGLEFTFENIKTNKQTNLKRVKAKLCKGTNSS